MARCRSELVSLDKTPYYHVGSRCVRRAFLCGFDEESQRSYQHRKQWLVDRIRLLSSVFAIDICAYAVMSNHYHLVVKLCPDQTEHWSNAEILNRWTSLCKGPLLVQKSVKSERLSVVEQETLSNYINVYRQRLTSLSWFMKFLNEHIARAANNEDKCTGHFWEARFNSQGLPTNEALLACMVYVDLNPVRASIAKTPESSDYTSLQERIKHAFNPKVAIKEQIDNKQLCHFNIPIKPLAPFLGNGNTNLSNIPFSFKDYLLLVDWTGRAVRNDKRSAINENLPPILTRINTNNEEWLIQATGFEKWYRTKRNKVKNLSWA